MQRAYLTTLSIFRPLVGLPFLNNVGQPSRATYIPLTYTGEKGAYVLRR